MPESAYLFFTTDFNSKYFLFQFIQIEQNANKFYANSNLWLPNCLPMTRVIFLLCSAMSYLKQARPCIQKKKENTQKKHKFILFLKLLSNFDFLLPWFYIETSVCSLTE